MISSLALVRKLARPFPATLLALTVLTLLYATGLLEWETRQLVGHEVITGALLLIGLLLITGWQRTGAGRALSVALLGLGVAGLGIWMLIGGRVGADWFSALGWPDPRSDQHAAGIATLTLLSAGVVAGAVLRSARRQRSGLGNDETLPLSPEGRPGPLKPVRMDGDDTPAAA